MCGTGDTGAFEITINDTRGHNLFSHLLFGCS